MRGISGFASCQGRARLRSVLLTMEVGLTVVPATESARRFADELGPLNQRLAVLCDRVVLVVAGHPLPIKPPRT